MKKFIALTASIFVYVGLFQFFFHSHMFLQDIDWQIFGFCLSAAAYFIIAGGLFRRFLKIRWWQLWLSMNTAGYILSFIVWQKLEPWQETIDFLLLLAVVTISLAATWLLVGFVFFCAWVILSVCKNKSSKKADIK